MAGWIGVDLDGTLAEYKGWMGAEHIGEPIPAMVERVKKWLADGRDVRIFTARVAGQRGLSIDFSAHATIIRWCEKHLGQALHVTCQKDMEMVELWDDRCVTVQTNTGRVLSITTRCGDEP